MKRKRGELGVGQVDRRYRNRLQITKGFSLIEKSN